MIVTRGEDYELKRYPRKKDSPYEFDSVPDVVFRGRPAGQSERKTYRVQQGVEGNNDSIYIMSSNLPTGIKPKDRVSFMGKVYSVQSVGYFLDRNLIVNARSFSVEYLESRCPKGVVLA